MANPTNKFWTSLINCEIVKRNPILMQHFKRENKSSTMVENIVKCQFCFLSKTPKVVIKSRRDKTKQKVKKVFLFCKFCGNKKTQLCGELKPAKKVKARKDNSELQMMTKPVQETNSKPADMKLKEDKKKRKKKDQNAGLIIPPSLSKPSPSSRSFLKNAQLLKMIKASEDNEKEDRLKSFLKK